VRRHNAVRRCRPSSDVDRRATLGELYVPRATAGVRRRCCASKPPGTTYPMAATTRNTRATLHLAGRCYARSRAGPRAGRGDRDATVRANGHRAGRTNKRHFFGATPHTCMDICACRADRALYIRPVLRHADTAFAAYCCGLCRWPTPLGTCRRPGSSIARFVPL